MKLIDEKGRLFGKVNIFDFIVLAALVLVIGAVGYKVAGKSRENAVGTKTYIATVKCSAMPDTFAAALKLDDRIYYDDGFANATIINVREEPAVQEVTTADGKIVLAESPTLKDVYVDIEITDKLSDADIRVGRYSVGVGAKFTVKTICAVGAESVVMELKAK